MWKIQKNFEVKMRQRGLINMHTKESFIGRHFGIRCIEVTTPLTTIEAIIPRGPVKLNV